MRQGAEERVEAAESLYRIVNALCARRRTGGPSSCPIARISVHFRGTSIANSARHEITQRVTPRILHARSYFCHSWITSRELRRFAYLTELDSRRPSCSEHVGRRW